MKDKTRPDPPEEGEPSTLELDPELDFLLRLWGDPLLSLDRKLMGTFGSVPSDVNPVPEPEKTSKKKTQ